MRTYSMLASRPGGYMNWPGGTITTQCRIRPTLILMFRKWFGRDPDKFHWHKDGFMAQAWDKRGNCIELEQENWRPKFRGLLYPPAIRPTMALAPLTLNPQSSTTN